VLLYSVIMDVIDNVIMLKRTPNPTDEDIDNQMTNICRCGTYVRVRQAIKIAAAKLATEVT